MTALLTLIVCLKLGSLAHAAGETYELVYSYYGTGAEKMRRETVIEVSRGGDRTQIQRRIYLDGKNELREASFYNTDRKKWDLYPGDKVPAHKLAELQWATNNVKKRSLEKPEDKDDPESPVRLASARIRRPDNPNAIVCEKAGNEFVICDGIPYRKERSGAINGTGREIKTPSERRPAITGPFKDETGVVPAE